MDKKRNLQNMSNIPGSSPENPIVHERAECVYLPKDEDRLALIGIIKNGIGGFEIWAEDILMQSLYGVSSNQPDSVQRIPKYERRANEDLLKIPWEEAHIESISLINITTLKALAKTCAEIVKAEGTEQKITVVQLLTNKKVQKLLRIVEGK